MYITAQKNLFALKELLDTNPQLFHSTPGDQAGARGATTSEQEAWKAEQSSVSQMLSLLTRTIEAISFALLLIDHRWGELIAQCDPSVQKSLSEMSFEDLVTSQNGVIVSRALVNVVIDQQIGQQISVCPCFFCLVLPHGLGLDDELVMPLRVADLVTFTACGRTLSADRQHAPELELTLTLSAAIGVALQVDTISDVLQQRSGSFCSTDDVMLYKVGCRFRGRAHRPLERILNPSLCRRRRTSAKPSRLGTSRRDKIG